MKKNNGYTLIEVIIVIAIMAILAGMSFVTIGIIKEAKCNEAAVTFNNQLSSLLVKTKALSEAKDSTLCMQIRFNADDVTYDDGTVAKKGSYSLMLGTLTGGTYADRNGNVAEATLPNLIKIKYKETADGSLSDVTDQKIEFNKSDGSVRQGAGYYEFMYGERKIATVYLDKTTGNHKIK